MSRSPRTWPSPRPLPRLGPRRGLLHGLLHALVLVAPGCAPAEEEEEEEADTYVFVDDDFDGWPLPQDCDDALPGIHPGASERCNGSDDDCDGVVDDHPVDGRVGWLDMDGDGWGDSSTRDLWCDEFEDDPRPWTTSEGDCDDGDVRVHPGGLETCGSPADEDCDGSENDPDATGCVPWYLDLDGDGLGTEESMCLCAADGSWRATAAGDCDDEDAAVTEGCAITGARSTADADVTIVGMDVGAQAGSVVSPAGDTNGDGWPELLVSVRSSTTPLRWWLLRAPFGATADLGAPSAAFLDPFFTSASRLAAAGGQDLDGDGVDDLVLGSYGSNVETGGRAVGVLYVVSGGATGTVDLTLADAVFQTMPATGTHDLRVAASPDTDGDGIGDLVVGGTDSANVYVWRGPLVADRDGSEADIVVSDTARRLGASVAAPGDLDGDGLGDLILGAPLASAGDGEVWIVGGTSSGQVARDDVAAILTGDTTQSFVGLDVASPGDVDGDGHPDILVSGDGAVDSATEAGSTWLLRGPLLGTVSVDTAVARVDGDDTDRAWVLGAPGDMDADGYADVVIGASGYDATWQLRGAALVFLGPLTGTLRAAEADLRFHGTEPRDQVGFAVAGAGDVNLDGFPDLLVGAPGADPGGTDAGAAYVVFGGAR